VYRWVDENGVVHFGDAIPPEYSRERHEVLDSRGTRTTVHDEKSPTDTPVRDDRDRALLATYGSVGRSRKFAIAAQLPDAQNAVAADRLVDLRARRTELDGDPAAINELATIEQRIVNTMQRSNGAMWRSPAFAASSTPISALSRTARLARRNRGRRKTAESRGPQVPTGSRMTEAASTARTGRKTHLTTSKRARTTGTMTIWAIRSPGCTVNGSAPRFHAETNTCPW
jgi:hypothetical protein